MASDRIPDTPREAVEQEVREHVGDIMFDGQESPNPDCLLCQKALDLGVWAEWGYPDPFTPDDQADGGW